MSTEHRKKNLPQEGPKTRQLLDIAAALIEHINDADFPAVLYNKLSAFVQLQSKSILVYRDDAEPLLIYHYMKAHEREHFEDGFLSGTYLLSPFYAAFKQKVRSGLYFLDDVAPDNFYQSEYYRAYYLPAHLSDVAYYIVNLNAGTSVFISLIRNKPGKPFSERDRMFFLAIKDVVCAAVHQHWHWLTSRNPVSNPARWARHKKMTAEFDDFGTEVLTKKEREIVKLLLQGHSSKSAARVLGIHHNTERVHRRNIYRKLEINSQTELLGIFLDKLSHDVH